MFFATILKIFKQYRLNPMETREIIHLREVKSFVRRQRRLTQRLEAAMEALWPQYGVKIDDTELDMKTLFGRDAETILEIGFGHGDTLLPMAKANPDKNYLGIEVHEPGVAAVMAGMLEHELTNIRVIQHDAVKILENLIADNTFSRVHIYFPDPWQKKRHHKRRIIQADFVELLCAKLTATGVIHCATDWQNYSEHMMSVLSGNSQLKNTMGEMQFANNAELHLRANTKFEMRGVKLGHGVWDLVFAK